MKNTHRNTASAPPDKPRIYRSRLGEKKYSIVHISDPHLSRRYYREHIKSFTLLLRNLLKTGFDHIVITGDIVSTGDAEDFYVARKLLGRYDLLDSERLTVVPGNHDIFGGPHRAVDVLSFPKYIRNIDYERNLALFNEAFTETFDNVKRLSNSSLYPFIKEVGPFEILGLNSIPKWSLRLNPVGSNGDIGYSQFEALDKYSRGTDTGDKILIAAIHHHFNHLVSDPAMKNTLFRQIESKVMRMRKRRKLIKIFKEMNLRYVLHGHIHRNELYEREGIIFANGAGAVCNDPVNLLKFNRLYFNNNESSLQTYTLPIENNHPTKKSALQKMRNDILIHRAAAAMTALS